ncbi:TrmH family RNA methyltransferase [Brachybacterium phenoliresistens]|uniref:RNA methyltransferase n=1 Tax=Brachybacterium phenoliresistens TaxID=396014 RepID=Z9JXI7_9MICO|nr:RNA methyltransferase [Brachybacterium phenoliresistens]EWS82728.1 RNA methyltransferase [Brachybacterium phenoliresistens]
MIERIDSAEDPRLDDYLRMTDVRLRSRIEPERGLFMAESYEVISRALDAGHAPRSFLMSEKWLPRFAPLFEPWPDVPVFVGEAALLEQLTGFHLHRGALAAMQRPVLRTVPELLASRERSRVAIIEDIVDHTNVGAIFRSAAALGVDAVLVTPRCADPLYRRAIRVSMGTVFQVPWTRIDPWPGGIAALQEAGYVVAGMTLGEGSIALDELVAECPEKLALVFGTEGHGLTPAADRLLDRRVTIPMMHGVDSLNVAASSAVAFYATRAQPRT